MATTLAEHQKQQRSTPKITNPVEPQAPVTGPIAEVVRPRRVRATQPGWDNTRLRYEGEEFTLVVDHRLEPPKWVEFLDGED